MLAKATMLSLWTLSVLGTVGALVTDEPNVDRSGKPIAVLAGKAGDVQYRPGDLMLWSDVLPEQVFFEGDNLATAAGAKARVDFIDGRSVLLGENTQVTISSAEEKADSSLVSSLREMSFGPDDGRTKRKKNIVTLVKGSVIASQAKKTIDLAEVERRRLAAERALLAKSQEEARRRQQEQQRLAKIRADLKKQQSAARRQELARVQKKLQSQRFAVKGTKIASAAPTSAPLAVNAGSTLNLASHNATNFGLENLKANNIVSTKDFKRKAAVPLEVKDQTTSYNLASPKARLALFKPEAQSRSQVRSSTGSIKVKKQAKPKATRLAAKPLKMLDKESEDTAPEVVAAPEDKQPELKAPTPKLIVRSPRLTSPAANTIMWTDRSLATAPRLSLQIDPGVTHAAKNVETIAVIRALNKRGKKLTLRSTKHSRRSVEVSLRKLSQRGFVSNYQGIMDQLELSIKVGAKFDGQEKVRWSTRPVIITVRSLATSHTGPVAVSLNVLRSAAYPKGSWFYQTGENPNAATKVILAKANQLAKLAPALKAAARFSIRQSAFPLQNATYIASGRDILARIDGNYSNPGVKAIRLMIGGKIAFSGPADVYASYPQIATEGFKIDYRRRVFVIQNGNLISVDKSFLDSNNEVQEFVSKNFKRQLKKPPLEILDR